MSRPHINKPLKLKSALVAVLFVATQLSFALNGGRVFAAEETDTTTAETTSLALPASGNAAEQQGPTNPTAIEAMQHGQTNQDTAGGPATQANKDEESPADVPATVSALVDKTIPKNDNNGTTSLVTTMVAVNTEVANTESVTLCHATGSTTNPFVSITVDAAGAFNGHLGNSHQNGEDIIPPFTFNGQSHSQNWNTAGQAIFNNGCVAPTGGGGEENNVTLCHATGSTTNPFVQITVSAAGAFNGHLGASHQNGEDIIPPFTFNGQTYSQNWDTQGQATFNNGCVPPTNGGNNEDKVTLCHATGSTTNPFVRITVSVSGAFNGHLGASHQNGEDIIPPFTFNGQSYSQNWDAAGQATFNNGCVVPTGGQGGNEGGQVLGASTTTPAGGQGAGELVNTGQNTILSALISSTILVLTLGAYYLSRKQYA